jgi:hypothetical protein
MAACKVPALLHIFLLFAGQWHREAAMALPSLYQAAQSLQLNIFLHRLNDRCDITGQILRRWLRHYLDQFLALYQHTHQPEQTALTSGARAPR